MSSITVAFGHRAQTLRFVLLSIMMAVLLAAGGASRADALGQFVVRFAAWLTLLFLLVRASWPRWDDIRPLAAFLLCAIGLVALQLLPLPPAIWTALPGRGVLEKAALSLGEPQPWRPLSISPDATRNALSSLVIPATVLMLLAGFDYRRHLQLLALLVAMVAVSASLCVLQFTAVDFDHPMINDLPGGIAGLFANPNHMALFIAIGCLLVPGFVLQKIRHTLLSLALSSAAILVLVLVAMATGSRSGLVLCAIGIALGVLTVGRRIVDGLRSIPRSVAIVLAALTALTMVGTIFASIALDRAASVERALDMDTFGDIRFAVWGTTVMMIQRYLPFGTGFGTYDPVYRISEATNDLGQKYINQAHNDVLQLALDGGLFAVLLMIWAMIWWGRCSLYAWRDHNAMLARLGSAMLFLVFIASLIDYPARTPMIMAVSVIGAVWLSTVHHRGSRERIGKQGRFK